MEPAARHILLVDDDPENLRLLGRLLAQEGYRIHAADSGERALEIVAMTAGEPSFDLVLLDILMPGGLDGIETCRRLRAHLATRDTPVIFLTAKHDAPTMVAAFEAGGADFVPKPCDARVLLARVRTHVELGSLSRRLEQTLTERTSELREANAALRRLAMEIYQTEERERERLAGELHDSPMQALALAQAQIVSAARCRDEESDQQLEAGLELLRDALQELRSLQFELSPPVLRREGLIPALRWLATHGTRRFGVDISFAESGSAVDLGHGLAVVLFRCAWELVHNLAKHAEASAGHIALCVLDDEIRLTVSDNGKGFPQGEVRPRAADSGGYGLPSVRERLALLGGKLSIDTVAAGSSLSIRVPLAAAANVPAGVTANPIGAEAR